MGLVECVPNVSEGREPGTIRLLEEAIQDVSGVRLLHTDSGYDAHRTVFTFVAEPRPILEAAFCLIEAALQHIDMRVHQGAHPRLGAVDVVPFIPLHGATMKECVELAHSLSSRLWNELGVPVYLYEEASAREWRKYLFDIRRGEYEGLLERLKDDRWSPDYGIAELHERFGAVIVGAQKFLIAFNVNLDTRDVQLASTIAKRIRTSGYLENGVRIPGSLAACRAIGWDMPKFNCAQVSMNLFDYTLTSPLDALEACRREAHALGARITGTELVGLLPLDALLKVASQLGVSGAENAQVQAAAEALMLSEFNPFKPEERIIEYLLSGNP